MDVSNHLTGSPDSLETTDGQPDGEELIRQLVSATGLPENLAHQELSDILRLSGKDSDELTLEHLREAMMTYLQALDSAQSSANNAESPEPSLHPDTEPLG